jgi:hypothetical protein
MIAVFMSYYFAVLAQLVEHSAVNRAVAGSNPADGAIIFLFFCHFYRKYLNTDKDKDNTVTGG